ncbi:hypothetical protein GPECTOR_132g607 [Gonium pectorale]|uniref:Uncharacterized protein n=1 Tax=Gonium pectorale TaxID=33097 RepID=A0A150FZF4_GONPE|nr:hypothetical protein GPECTOR_132g607 [Gonium pectorale]|eukprot:KXZ42595.1 hypothetical protein GPECTOR_132g607 [Gonium pectorale]
MYGAWQRPSAEARSPPAAHGTFSPVFDLELGGSCTATPQDRRASRAGDDAPRHSTPLHSSVAAAAGIGQRPKLASAAARQQTHALKAIAPGLVVPAGGALDRSQSDLQVMLLHHGTAKAAAAQSAEPLTAEAERLLELCRPATELELELSRRLRAFRASRIAKAPPDGGAASAAAATAAASSASSSSSAVAGPGGPGGPTPGEIEALAAELQAAGFLVQLLDGTRLSKDARSCLRTLKHRFLVCLGWARPQQQQATTAVTAAGRGAPGGGVADLVPQRLTEPLVVEVRFREQFLIANPSRDYEHLLLALPVAFVGPLRRLDAALEVVAAAVARVFRAAGRPLPPWRTKGAMLSKWAPVQLLELERRLQQAEQVAAQQQQLAEQVAAQAEARQHAERLEQEQDGAAAGRQKEEKGQQQEADADVSWGSAVTAAAEQDPVGLGLGMGMGLFEVAAGPGRCRRAFEVPHTSAEGFAFTDLEEELDDPQRGGANGGDADGDGSARSSSEPLLLLQRTRRASIASAAAAAAAAKAMAMAGGAAGGGCGDGVSSGAYDGHIMMIDMDQGPGAGAGAGEAGGSAQQQQRRATTSPTAAAAPAGGAVAAGAGGAGGLSKALGAAAKAGAAGDKPGGGGGGAAGGGGGAGAMVAGATQVALAGGVMTRPSPEGPAWARISTVRWGPAPAPAPGGAARRTARRGHDADGCAGDGGRAAGGGRRRSRRG